MEPKHGVGQRVVNPVGEGGRATPKLGWLAVPVEVVGRVIINRQAKFSAQFFKFNLPRQSGRLFAVQALERLRHAVIQKSPGLVANAVQIVGGFLPKNNWGWARLPKWRHSLCQSPH